jgi:ABC-type transporter Mla MlaB component
LKGVLGTGSKEMLSQLSAYAASKQEVVVDMGGLLRIDFAAMGLFFEAIRAIHLAQKRVILSNLNELVAALLEVFSLNKHAILMRKKAS